jgi:DNA polymerase V
VSVGIASTKTLAKLASRIAKKTPARQGSFDLTAVPDLDAILAQVPCGQIWGIGRRTAARLTPQGIHTALDLKNADMAWLRRELGVVGERTARELSGVSCLELDEVAEPQKGIATARSFGYPVESLEELEQALANYTARAAEKLRAGGQLAGHIQIYLETSPFRPDQPQYYPAANASLSEPTCHTPALIATAMSLLRRIYRPGVVYRKVGVFLTDLCQESSTQLQLFETPQTRPSSRRLDVLVDQINRRYGSNTVRYGTMGFQQKWQMKQTRKSRSFTTRWDELLVASATTPI